MSKLPFQNNWKLNKKEYTKTIYSKKLTLNEYPNNILLKSHLINETPDVEFTSNKPQAKYFKTEKQQLQKYHTQNYIRSSECHVVTMSLPPHKWGRVTPTNYLSLAVLHRPTRHALCKDIYNDFDMINACPQILLEISKQNEIENKVPTLNKYCSNREKILSQIQSHHNVNRDTAKNLFIVLGMGGSYKSWYKSNNIPKTDTPLTFIEEMENEYQFLMSIIYENNLQIIIDVLKEQPNKFDEYNGNETGKTNAKKRTCMALFYQTIERKIQETMIEFLVKQRNFKLEDIVPCQDGFMILKELYQECLLTECEDAVYKKFGFKIPMKNKPFDEAIEIPINENIENDEEIELEDAIQMFLNDYKCVPDEIALKSNHQNCNRFLLNSLSNNTDCNLASVYKEFWGDTVVCICIKPMMFYIFQDHKWNEDKGLSVRSVLSNELVEIYKSLILNLQTILNICRPELNIKSLSNEQKEVLKDDPISSCFNHYIQMAQKIIIKLSSTTHKNNVLREIGEICQNTSFEEQIDTNPYLLCCSNGVIDLKEKVFRDGKPSDMCSRCTNIPYQPLETIDEKSIENVFQFLKQLFPIDEIRDFMIQHLSACLIGKNVEQSFYNYIGIGSNGKSTLIEAMGYVLGNYKASVPIELVTSKRPKIGGTSSEIAQLRGVRYAVMQEPSKGMYINEGVMKELTGGDPLTGRELFKKSVTFETMFNLVVCTNYLMNIKSNDDGTWRRIKVVPFESKFVNDESKISADNQDFEHVKIKNITNLLKEMSVPFLSYLVHNAFIYQGSVNESSIVSNATLKYKLSQDRIGQYIRECLTSKSGVKIKKRDLSASFKNWFVENFKYSVDSKELFDVLDKEEYDLVGDYYYGIELTDLDNDRKLEEETKEAEFIRHFNECFEITGNKSDFIKTVRINEWAKQKNLKVSTSKQINSIMKSEFGYDSSNPEQYKRKKINGVIDWMWFGIKEKL